MAAHQIDVAAAPHPRRRLREVEAEIGRLFESGEAEGSFYVIERGRFRPLPHRLRGERDRLERELAERNRGLVHQMLRAFKARYMRPCSAPRARRPRAPRRRNVRTAPRRARAPASSSAGDLPDPPPPGGIWAYLALASARMVAHERRREARWRRGAPV